MTELKQCPFCSGEASIYHGDSTDGYIKGTGYVEVFCGWCGARIREKKEDEVIKKWNTRPNPWHTGTPTEKGEYLCEYYINEISKEFSIRHYDPDDDWFVNNWEKAKKNLRMIRWQRYYEPSKEASK